MNYQLNKRLVQLETQSQVKTHWLLLIIAQYETVESAIARWLDSHHLDALPDNYRVHAVTGVNTAKHSSI